MIRLDRKQDIASVLFLHHLLINISTFVYLLTLSFLFDYSSHLKPVAGPILNLLPKSLHLFYTGTVLYCTVTTDPDVGLHESYKTSDPENDFLRVHRL